MNKLNTHAKVILVGESNVGKTNIATRIYNKKFNIDEPTIGANFFSITFIDDNNKYKMQIWDTAGQEKYRSFIPMFIRGVNVVLFIYDKCDTHGFDNIFNYWIPYIKSLLEYVPIMYVISNKEDLKCDHISDDILNQTIGNDVKFFKTSAKNNVGIEELLIELKKDVKQFGISTPIEQSIIQTYHCCR